MDEMITGSELEADFQRKVYSISGLPFDALDMGATVAWIYSAIDTKEHCFISTPNLNFLIASQTDSAFRHSVISSDLSLADGMPLIWIARLLKIPFRERLAGSSLIEALMFSEFKRKDPVKVFFFGGTDGVADIACKKLDKKNCRLRCAGSLNPGFGSIEEMSKASIIDQVNRSGADFVIVSLGAKKGQEWIGRNRHRLEAPVISHLGAVVNFVAGTINRAPGFWQDLGLEWLWRIKEEPKLWKRYLLDGIGFIKLLFSQVLPYALLIRRKQRSITAVMPFSVDVKQNEGQKNVSIKGGVKPEQLAVLRDLFLTVVPGEESICIKLDDTVQIDPAFCGLILVLYKHVGDRLCLVSDSVLTRKELVFNRIDFLLE